MVKEPSANLPNILFKCSVISTFYVSVEKHRILNTCCGVISEPNLLYSTKEEILDHLKSQNVIKVHRITIRRKGQILPAEHIILTFTSPIFPKRIKAAYLNFSVLPHISNPLQHQHYGHSKFFCHGSVTCARCVEVGDDKNCDKSELCVNLEGILSQMNS